ncbi:unnamed protein product, partial [Effrenium voratum]
MAGSPMPPSGGFDKDGAPVQEMSERRQRRLKRLRAEKEEIQAALRESRLKVRQLEAAQVLFTAPEVENTELCLSPASSTCDPEPQRFCVQEGPAAAQNLLRWRQLRRVLQGHQETLEHEKSMWQTVLQQQEEDGKQLRQRVAEAQEMQQLTESRVQNLMDLMVALLSPGYSPESQQELVQSKYLAMVQDLDVHCSRVSERVAAFQTALEGERGENCCRALQLCDQQRRTTRLHEVLCQLQSELFQTRRDAGKRTADAPTETAGKQEIPLGSSGSAQTNGTLPASHPVALGVSQDTAVETHSADAADPKAAAAEVSRAPPEPSPAPAVTPVTPVNPERGSERDRVESAMREILEELRFEHLVMRCQGCYEFGALARAQLRMDNDTLTASVDGVMYEPFKEFICKLQ